MNPDNSQKTPLAQSLSKLAGGKANDATWQQPKTLPCTVAKVIGPSVVEVNFEVSTTPFTVPQLTIPVLKPPYVQYPIQVGDIGIALAADLRLAPITGLGTGTPSLTDTVGNLSTLCFVWLGHSSEAFIDPAALALYGNILCTPSALSFFAAPKVAKQSLPAAATDEATTMALANVIRTLLINYGLAS